jgi:hypothetical protein
MIFFFNVQQRSPLHAKTSTLLNRPEVADRLLLAKSARPPESQTARERRMRVKAKAKIQSTD